MASHIVYLDVPDDIFDKLTKHADEQQFGTKTKELLFTILRDWDTETLPAPLLPEAFIDVSKERGYQWKQLFLPEGTMLRQAFQGTAYYARVVGEKILCNEAHISPSQFVNMHGGGNRNAWHTIWLRFPRETVWRRADQCRVPS